MGTRRTFIATYVMGSGRNGTLYTGMTANLVTRVWKHRTHAFPGFTADHECTRLLWFERHAWGPPPSGARSGSGNGRATGSWR